MARFGRAFPIPHGVRKPPVLALVIVSPSGIASGEAVGEPLIRDQRFLSPTGISSGGAFGTPFLQATLGPGGVASGEGIGTPFLIEQGYIGPAGLASGFAAGEPFIANRRFVEPDGLASGFAAGQPFLANRRFVNPGGVNTGLGLGVPLVAGGALMPSGIAGASAVGSPTILVQQIITITAGIASGGAIGQPRIGHTSTVMPSGVATGFGAGTPKLVGSTRHILAFGVPPGNAGIPKIVGGDTSLKFYLSGEDQTSRFMVMSAEVYSQTIGRWQANFQLHDASGAFAPALGQQCMIQEGGLKLFAGCLASVEIRRAMSTTRELFFPCTAVDKNGIFDHRVVKGNVYPAGMDVAEVILDIVATSVNGEGITTNNVPRDGSLGVLESSETFNFPYVAQAFDRIATISGTVWFVDENGDLHFNSLANLEDAPFQITENGKDWRDLVVKTTLLNYRNTQYAVSNRTILPGANSTGGGSSATGRIESFTWANGADGVDSQIEPVFGLQPYQIRPALPIGTVLSITVNGHAQTVVELSSFAGQNSSGPNDYLFFYLMGQNAAYPVEFPLPTNATVVINYIPQTNNTGVHLAEALAPSDPITADPLGTCGSGKYEAVEQVQDIVTQEDLNAIAQAVLTRSGGVPTVVELETDRPGLKPGQLLTVNLPNALLPTKKLLITGVHGISMGADLGHGCSFRWTITAQSNEDPGNWIKFFERLVARTQQPLPVPDFEVASFVLAPGSSLAGGVVSTNPVIVKRTGLLVDMYGAFELPPVDQELTLYAFLNGVQLPGSVTIPANSAPNTIYRFTFPTDSPKYVFAGSNFNDVITVAGTYRVTGPNPAKASNGTFDIRWTM